MVVALLAVTARPPPEDIAISGGPFQPAQQCHPGCHTGLYAGANRPATGARIWSIQIGNAFRMDANGVIRVNVVLANPSDTLNVQLEVSGATGSTAVRVTVITVISLTAGQRQDYGFGVSAGSIDRAGMEQISCPAISNACCALGIADNGIPLPAGETVDTFERFSHYTANA